MSLAVLKRLRSFKTIATRKGKPAVRQGRKAVSLWAGSEGWMIVWLPKGGREKEFTFLFT